MPAMAIVLATSAVVPALLCMWYFWARDIYPEPGRVVWTTFGLGVVILAPVAGIGLAAHSLIQGIADPWAAGLADAFLAAAIPEELGKFAILYFYCRRHDEFDEPMDGLVYGVAASMGFAALENVLYVWQGGLGVAVIRALTAVPNHAVFGAIMGYYLVLHHFRPDRRALYLAQALAVPIVLHGLYDLPLMVADRLPEAHGARLFLYAGAFAVLTAGIGFALALLKRVRAIQASPAGGPGHGRLDAFHGAGAAAWHPRSWALLLVGGLVAWGAAGMAAGAAVATAAGQGSNAMVVVGVACLGAIWLGVKLFRTGLARLNRQPSATGGDRHGHGRKL